MADDQFHAFIVQTDIPPEKDGILSGYTVSLKDAIWVKDIESTATSDILRSFRPVEHSTVAKRILESGGRIIGKTVQDAFGFGSYGTHVGHGYEKPLNPYDTSRAAGGSSGGAAVAAASIKDHIAIAESTGGSIVTPAAFCGVVGFCPTYGRVSRYGLISYASSLDKIGVMGKGVEETAIGLQAIAGKDAKDETCIPMEGEKYISKEPAFDKMIGVLHFDGVDEQIQKRCDTIIGKLKEKGATIKEIDLPFTKKYALSAYYVIAMSEASTHLACLSGLRYGQAGDLQKTYNEYFTDVRTRHFNKETKRRALLGTFTRMSGYRGKYYVKALKVRKKIMDEYTSIFSDVNAIIMPTVPTIAPQFDEIDKMSPAQELLFDFLTVGPNIAGLPHMSIPIQQEGELPYGIMIVGKHLSEPELISIGKGIEVVRDE
ncbi:MAG: amidase family protein [Nanoarchaeota archaeon]